VIQKSHFLDYFSKTMVHRGEDRTESGMRLVMGNLKFGED
jgi:hypothetical protein